ncbi:hypothetical protein J7E73_22765 [Paenibacillus albidus]|uniref:stalk domain-containing protein n=1 Tax=Paenibacillus albidus TaxID=2041023 RepID=UPI001BE9A417|nr:stalk domain-containing protein [Paenibacillus albidus]MBT2291897.1 hypothetical protein [Paenibacillus albidus]
MKKFLSLIGMSLLALILAVPAFAATKPINVYINGSKVSFTAGAPYLKNNSVLVPFRVIFEELGLNVLWDAATGTVTGTSPTLKISLKIGSNRASVNGTVKKLAIAPVSANGTTYIPLRFIAEATGGTASWNSTNRTVKIQTPASSASDEAAIRALIQLSNQYYNEEKAISFYSLMDSEASFAESVSDMNNAFETYDIKSIIESMEIVNLKGDEATVYTVERTLWKGGYYIPDELDEYMYTLVRKNGTWKIADLESQANKVLLTRAQGMKAATVPQTESSAIIANVGKYYQYMNEKNTAGVLSTMTSYGEEYDASLKSDYEDFFASYDLTYTLGATNIFHYSDKDAAVYVEAKDKEASEDETYEQALIFILSKSESGAWTIDETYSVSYNEV